MLRLPRREDAATVVSCSVDANVPKREGRREKENAEILRMQTGPDSIATLFVFQCASKSPSVAPSTYVI